MLRSEKPLLMVCLLAAGGYAATPLLERLSEWPSLLETVVLIVAILVASLSVARHAERIAQKLVIPTGA
ncbi:hypothetical protein [Achromobacter sp. UMC46]|uniref:hypothetical protein n=1 Tax=Achromobacter sp. UMC46 TaxID=1862319 RepID=UPI0021085B0B|nr:hypothetical protein [Achromobacter sp. UMC46]